MVFLSFHICKILKNLLKVWVGLANEWWTSVKRPQCGLARELQWGDYIFFDFSFPTTRVQHSIEQVFATSWIFVEAIVVVQPKIFVFLYPFDIKSVKIPFLFFEVWKAGTNEIWEASTNEVWANSRKNT